MSIAAMKQALHVLESVDGTPVCNETDYLDLSEDIAALRAAIAEASMQRLTDVQQEMEQEPVAYITGYYNGRPVVKPVDSSRLLPTGMALYGTPKEGDRLSLPRREWAGLTDE
jgi:hypothetical protein